MKFQIGMENGDENRSVAWVLGHPGCFAYGRDSQEAFQAVPKAVADYREWIRAHSGGCLHTPNLEPFTPDPNDPLI